jgi:Ribbon-helix-helix domain
MRREASVWDMKKSDVSKFMEKAMRWGVFHSTVQAIKTQNADLDPQHLQSVVDGAVRELRAEYRNKARAHKS